jgi:hypothetical protein
MLNLNDDELNGVSGGTGSLGDVLTYVRSYTAALGAESPVQLPSLPAAWGAASGGAGSGSGGGGSCPNGCHSPA